MPPKYKCGCHKPAVSLNRFFISDDDNAMSSKTERISFKGFLRSSVNLVEIYRLTFKSNYEFAMLGLLTNSNDNQHDNI